ncbi:15-hydroxyprostaglandin dehydrogenase [NAD(+)]-like [Phlebotomus argentipes]|uniref:15-hydroxyprostaglandin dehydrogenase [NAD(+)]-like n=1 Tax=Phlebotomus argentipes TaxID=94469 RepID=UPI002892C1AA|nr:15-hydroxyprostaglandin dehydrogenase [NAD(+)]-like [Phlebotomus argentipes]
MCVEMSLVNKSALITGATGGIGHAICREFLKHGVKNLAIVDLHPQEPKIVGDLRREFEDVSVRYYQVDVASHDEIEKCYEEFTKVIPSLDIVVNCAGIFNESQYHAVVNVNLNGVIGSTRLAIDHMNVSTGRGKGGCVINIASIAGLTTLSCTPTYSATKQGVIAYTRAVAFKREKLGIKFLTICPGATQSQMYDQSAKPEFFFMSSAEEVQGFLDRFPKQQAQNPCEIGKAAVKIIKEAANGSVWIVDRGELSEAHVADPIF